MEIVHLFKTVHLKIWPHLNNNLPAPLFYFLFTFTNQLMEIIQSAQINWRNKSAKNAGEKNRFLSPTKKNHINYWKSNGRKLTMTLQNHLLLLCLCSCYIDATFFIWLRPFKISETGDQLSWPMLRWQFRASSIHFNKVPRYRQPFFKWEITKLFVVAVCYCCCWCC